VVIGAFAQSPPSDRIGPGRSSVADRRLQIVDSGSIADGPPEGVFWKSPVAA
jgi:hypothetical protein